MVHFQSLLYRQAYLFSCTKNISSTTRGDRQLRPKSKMTPAISALTTRQRACLEHHVPMSITQLSRTFLSAFTTKSIDVRKLKLLLISCCRVVSV